MGAQNFNFAVNTFPSGFLAPNLAFLDENFNKKFRTIIRQPKLQGKGGCPLSQRQWAMRLFLMWSLIISW